VNTVILSLSLAGRSACFTGEECDRPGTSADTVAFSEATGLATDIPSKKVNSTRLVENKH
jgi:hypothetical protein